VGYRQLLELGLSEDGVHGRVAAGRLHPVFRGAYAVGHPHLSIRGRWMAAVLACGPGAALSHRSAAALWEILVTGTGRIDVMTATRSRHNRRGIAHHRPRRLEQEDTAVKDGIPVTSVARTLLDLAALVNARRLRRALAEADRREVFDLGLVERLLDRTAGHRGRGRLQRALSEYRAPPWTRSGLERLFLDLCDEACLPQPRVNSFVEGHEVDFVWAAQRLIVELDGYAYHHHRRAFEDDRARDAALQLAGYRVLRFTDRRLERDRAEVVRILRGLLNPSRASGAAR
jgi:hypothetical protein